MTQHRRWVRPAQAVTALVVGALVWLVAVRPSGDPEPVKSSSSEAPLVTVMPEFTLDAEVVGSADVGLLYVLEHRARPNYRILKLDTSTGDLANVFSVPDRAVVYSTAVSADGSRMAVAYTEDFSLDSNGIYFIDPARSDQAPTSLVEPQTGVYYTDLLWDEAAQEIWATRVDRTGDDELLSIQSFDAESGKPHIEIQDAVDPAVGDGWLAYLPLEADGSRRVIETRTDPAGDIVRHDIFDLGYDLDHLIYDPASKRLVVAAILLEGQPSISLGSPAGAHGDHDKPAQLFSVDPVSGEPAGPLTEDATIIYDTTVLGDGSLAYVTREGLSVLDPIPRIATNDPVPSTPILESRALRMITD